MTLSEVIRDAISTEKYITEEIACGGSVLIEEKSGRVKEIVFR